MPPSREPVAPTRPPAGDDDGHVIEPRVEEAVAGCRGRAGERFDQEHRVGGDADVDDLMCMAVRLAPVKCRPAAARNALFDGLDQFDVLLQQRVDEFAQGYPARLRPRGKKGQHVSLQMHGRRKDRALTKKSTAPAVRKIVFVLHGF
jgi:hypothetical protein